MSYAIESDYQTVCRELRESRDALAFAERERNVATRALADAQAMIAELAAPDGSDPRDKVLAKAEEELDSLRAQHDELGETAKHYCEKMQQREAERNEARQILVQCSDIICGMIEGGTRRETEVALCSYLMDALPSAETIGVWDKGRFGAHAERGSR